MEVVVEVEVVVEAEVVVVEVVAAAEATEYLHRDVPEGHHQIAHEEALPSQRAEVEPDQTLRWRDGAVQCVGSNAGLLREDKDGDEESVERRGWLEARVRGLAAILFTHLGPARADVSHDVGL